MLCQIRLERVALAFFFIRKEKAVGDLLGENKNVLSKKEKTEIVDTVWLKK